MPANLGPSLIWGPRLWPNWPMPKAGPAHAKTASIQLERSSVGLLGLQCQHQWLHAYLVMCVCLHNVLADLKSHWKCVAALMSF